MKPLSIIMFVCTVISKVELLWHSFSFKSNSAPLKVTVELRNTPRIVVSVTKLWVISKYDFSLQILFCNEKSYLLFYVKFLVRYAK